MAKSNRAEWQKRVERWRDSGLSAKEFAAETGLKASTLSYWKWRLGAEQRAGEPTGSVSARQRERDVAPSGATFVEVTRAVAPVPTPVELVISEAITVRVSVGFDEATLGRVLRVIGAVR